MIRLGRIGIQLEWDESTQSVWPQRLGRYDWGDHWFASLLWFGVHVYWWRRP